MKRSVWSAAALALVALAPGACSEAPDPAEAGPAAAEGITVANARLMLPAVAGNPGAVYFDVSNSGTENRVIRAVTIEGAGSAEIHTKDMQMVLQTAVPAGGTTQFAPGDKHIMAMDLTDGVAAGSQAEVTLTFVGGSEVKFPADVRAAGDER